MPAVPLTQVPAVVRGQLKRGIGPSRKEGGEDAGKVWEELNSKAALRTSSVERGTSRAPTWVG